MKKIILSVSIVCTIILVAGVSTILYADFKSAYQQIAGTIKVDPASIKTEDVQIVKFPFPHVKIKHIKQEGKIELSDAKIEFSMWSVFTLAPKISTISVKEASLRLNSDDTNLINHDQFIAELIQKDLLSIKTNIDKLTLIESDNDISMVMTNFSLKKSGKNYNFSARTNDNQNLQGNFQKTEGNIIFNLESVTDNYKLSLQETYKDNKLVTGTASFKDLDLSTPILSLFSNVITNLNHQGALEPITADFIFSSDENSWHISSLKLSADWLQGAGDIVISRGASTSEANLTFDKMDLSNLSSEGEDQVSVSHHKLAALKYNTNISCLIKQLSFKSEQLHDVTLKLVIADSKAKIENCTGNFDENHKFQINGELTSDSLRSAFDGEVVISHQDISKFANMFGDISFNQQKPLPFVLQSHVRITPVYFSFQNINLNLEGMNITGDYSTKFIGQLPRINANLKIDSLDLDKESAIDSINDIKKWLENSLSGMKQDDYQNKFIPIRKISSIGSYDITIDNLAYQTHKYNNISFNLETEPSSVAINRLYFNNGSTWFDLSASLSTKSLNPVLIVKINDGVIENTILSSQGLLDFRAKILEHLDLAKINFLVSGYLTAFKNGDNGLDRIIFSFKNDKNLLTFTDLNFDLFSGRLTMAGSVLLEPLTLNFSYALNAANLSKISAALPKNLLTLDGLVSNNGVFSTNGDSLEKLLYNLYNKSSLIAKGVVLNNFSIDQFIEKINNESYDANNLSYDVDKMLLTDNTTIIDLKSDVLLSKGVLDLTPMSFKTNLSSQTGNLKLNIYDYSLDGDLAVNFYILHKRKFKPASYQPLVVDLKASGDIMNLSRKITADKIAEVINMRNVEDTGSGSN